MCAHHPLRDRRDFPETAKIAADWRPFEGAESLWHSLTSPNGNFSRFVSGAKFRFLGNGRPVRQRQVSKPLSPRLPTQLRADQAAIRPIVDLDDGRRHSIKSRWSNSKPLKLLRPRGGQFAQPCNTYSAWEPAFDSRFDEVGSEKRKRQYHVDLARTAALALGNFIDIRHGATEQGAANA